MPWRRLCLAVAAGIALSGIIGLIIGTDIVVWFVQELVSRFIPSALDDGRFWQAMDVVVVPILAAPGIVLAACICAWRRRLR